jgi:hypothetical protein
MPHSLRNPFTTIRTEGALLPVDLLQRIVAGDPALGGLDPESYHLAGSEKLNEAINRAWNRLLGAWATFQTARGRLGEGDAGTTLTRERWLMPLFQELGYGRVQVAKAVTLDGKEYRVSHAWAETPIHLVGCGVNLDRRQPGVTGAAKSSPHSLVQEYLNRNPNQLWGMLSNGLTLRVLRDNASLTRSAYLEFDLEAMLTGEVYADFVVLWLVCHQSRVECQEGKPESCRLETWSKAAQEQGTRALDKLRDGVEAAITALGGGFLAHPGNTALKTRLRSGVLTREGYYRQLLRLVYRLIFLFAAEDRDLLLDPKASPAARERYMKYYSATHLRQLAEQSRGGRHPDLYATLRLVSAMLGGREKSGSGVKGLGIPVLGSFLFSNEALPDLESAELENGALLIAVRGLAFILDGNTRRVVDYRNLGTRELGSVYESLLELHPQINMEAGTFELITAAGNERKTTGSYYTAEDLIKVLLDSALDPVILRAIQRAGPSIESQIAALLALKVCDPACGSGHFLIAAARRIARRLAQLRSGDEEPSPETIRTALREAIQHCVYGVDINPMSVELCKVNLWLESIEPGKPLTFLESHIKGGNSLVGVGPGMDVYDLTIPDEAFEPVTGDDKKVSSTLKKRNKEERKGQIAFDFHGLHETPTEDYATFTRQLESMPEDTPEQVAAKEAAYTAMQANIQAQQRRLLADIWTAAFFWHLQTDPNGSLTAPTQGEWRNARLGNPATGLTSEAHRLGEYNSFFHWPLEFPDVFDQGGFDCVIGNPPWDMLQLDPQEFFAFSAPNIVKANTRALRDKLIVQLRDENPALFYSFQTTNHMIEAYQKYVHASERFPLTSFGRINLMALFAETSRVLISPTGRTGLVLPIGIATDSFNQYFFSDIVKSRNLERIIGFENESFIFPGVHHSFKFCIMVMAGVQNNLSNVHFSFFCRNIDDLRDDERHFTLSPEEISVFNPNTQTCPIFRTKTDAMLTKSIYKNGVIIQNDKNDENPWQVHGLLMFMMNTDSNLFSLTEAAGLLPLYEAKMIFQFDHRYASYENATQANLNSGILPQLSEEEKQNPSITSKPKFWIPANEVAKRIKGWKRNWFLGFRDITSSIVERTAIFTVLPYVGVGNSMPILFSSLDDMSLICCLLGNLNSIVFDYVTRQKIAGSHLNFFILNQLPVLPPSSYTPKAIDYISLRVLELVYTAYDIKSFALDLGYDGAPFQWDEKRRALLRAELDAYYARLYGLSRDELRYILDPWDVYGPNFPGETFRVLKEKEIRQYGEYRTRRLVLEAWDRLAEQMGEPDAVSLPVPAASMPKTDTVSIESNPVVEKVKEKAVPEPAPESQPMLSDFGLYKCAVCGKMVMGFEKEGHEREKHGNETVTWRKLG